MPQTEGLFMLQYIAGVKVNFVVVALNPTSYTKGATPVLYGTNLWSEMFLGLDVKQMKRLKLRPLREKPQHFWVTIFDTKKQLINQLKKDGMENEICDAICRSFERVHVHEDGTEEITSHIGNIYFHKKFLGAGVVAHELTHAALNYWKRILGYDYKDLKPAKEAGDVTEAEEKLCFIAQMLNREFWNKYKKLDV